MNAPGFVQPGEIIIVDVEPVKFRFQDRDSWRLASLTITDRAIYLSTNPYAGSIALLAAFSGAVLFGAVGGFLAGVPGLIIFAIAGVTAGLGVAAMMEGTSSRRLIETLHRSILDGAKETHIGIWTAIEFAPQGGRQLVVRVKRGWAHYELIAVAEGRERDENHRDGFNSGWWWVT